MSMHRYMNFDASQLIQVCMSLLNPEATSPFHFSSTYLTNEQAAHISTYIHVININFTKLPRSNLI